MTHPEPGTPVVAGLSADAFAWLAGLLKAHSGLVLGADKAYLLDCRLAPIARQHGCATLEALVARLRAAPEGPLVADVVEAMTTNETFFFRDGAPFAHVRAALPRLCAARPPGAGLRIWSAGCSTGQEAYSLAMLVAESRPQLGDRPVEILGTDLSLEVLTRAREGLYTQFEVQRGLPIAQLVRHFRRDGAGWRISEALRAMVSWRRCNLLDPLAPLGRFDVVFCRNVLLYFDQPTRSQVLEQIAGMLAPDGLLYLGGAETVLGLTGRLVPVAGQRGAYAPIPVAPMTVAPRPGTAGAVQPPATGGATATAMPVVRPLSASPALPAGRAGGRVLGGATKAGAAVLGSRST